VKNDCSIAAIELDIHDSYIDLVHDSVTLDLDIFWFHLQGDYHVRLVCSASATMRASRHL
jgi:hypothetical protein